MSETLQEIPLKRIDGSETRLSDFRGNVLLLVNVASQCGLTPQYSGLQSLYERFRDQGFAVLGFPANEFGSQEPGTNDEIAQFCETQFSVTFPMFEKIVVKGEGRHPLYDELVTSAAAGAPETRYPARGAPHREGILQRTRRRRDHVELREVRGRPQRRRRRALRAGRRA